MHRPTGPVTAFGPDFPFAFDDWIGHPDGLGQIPDEHVGREVAIIGAGVAGLVAGYELMKLGLRPVVYEAGRIGGRLRSEPFSAAPHVIAELGGMRFPVSATALYHYFDLCEIETRPFPNPLTAAAPTTVVDNSIDQLRRGRNLSVGRGRRRPTRRADLTAQSAYLRSRRSATPRGIVRCY